MPTKSIWKSEAGKTAVLTRYRQLLADWPDPHRQTVVETSLGPTFVIVSGRGLSPMLLLHGSASNSAVWMPVAAALGDTHTIYAVDIPGEPGLSSDLRPTLAGSGYMDWLSDVYTALSLTTAHLVGQSLGGYMALRFATQSPEKVSKLTLISPSGLTPSRSSFFLKAIPLMMMGQRGEKALLRLTCGDLIMDKEVEDYILLISRSFSPRLEAVPVIAESDLKELATPLHYIAGETDALLNTPKSAHRLKQLVPHARVDVLPGVGHVITDAASRLQASH